MTWFEISVGVCVWVMIVEGVGGQCDVVLEFVMTSYSSRTVGCADNDDYSQRMMDRRRSAEFQHAQAEARRVTQSISIRKPPMLRPLDTDSPMNSPGSYGCSPPASPSLASPSPSSKLLTPVHCISRVKCFLVRVFLCMLAYS